MFRIPLAPGPLSSPLNSARASFLFFCFRSLGLGPTRGTGGPGKLAAPPFSSSLSPFLCFCASGSQHPGAHGLGLPLACRPASFPFSPPRGPDGVVIPHFTHHHHHHDLPGRSQRDVSIRSPVENRRPLTSAPPLFLLFCLLFLKLVFNAFFSYDGVRGSAGPSHPDVQNVFYLLCVYQR